MTNVTINLMPPLRDVTLRQVLDAIAKVANSPIRYGVEDYAVVFSAVPPQVTIEVKFCEVPVKDTRALGLAWFPELTNGASNENWLLGLTNSTSSKSNGVAKGFLTDAQYRVVIRALEQRTGVNVLTLPKVTTLCGRQAEVKTVNVRYVVTGYDLSELVSNAVARAIAPNEVKPLAEQFELGPVLDVVPYAQADGRAIHMTVIPTITEFIGYDMGDAPRREIITTSDGRKEAVILPPEPRPIFRKLQFVTSVTAWDGQTIVLSGGSDLLLSNPIKNQPLREGTKLAQPKKETMLLVFITATLIDPAGNRIHEPKDLPTGIPPQENVPPRR